MIGLENDTFKSKVDEFLLSKSQSQRGNFKGLLGLDITYDTSSDKEDEDP